MGMRKGILGVTHILSDPKQAQGYAIEAFEDVEALYNWGRIARLTRAVYRRVVERVEVLRVV